MNSKNPNEPNDIQVDLLDPNVKIPSYSHPLPCPNAETLFSHQDVIAPSVEPTQKPTPSPQRYIFSLLLENKGSTARDHLANERTFLAWLRTSLALVTIGVAITQINKLVPSKPNEPDSPERGVEQRFQLVLGTFYMCAGILFVLFGLTRYFFIQTQLIRGMFPASRFTIVLGVMLLLAICTTLIYTFVGDLIH